LRTKKLELEFTASPIETEFPQEQVFLVKFQRISATSQLATATTRRSLLRQAWSKGKRSYRHARRDDQVYEKKRQEKKGRIGKRAGGMGNEKGKGGTSGSSNEIAHGLGSKKMGEGDKRRTEENKKSIINRPESSRLRPRRIVQREVGRKLQKEKKTFSPSSRLHICSRSAFVPRTPSQ
jgi:hypothetical protein